MELIRCKAMARAGLVGNPSDGYQGKTIAVGVPEYFAQVVMYEWEDLELIPSQEDQSRFKSMDDLAKDVELHGYYGGIRLVKATIKKFVEFCGGRYDLHDRNFSIRYESNIPRAVGMAGSSAIIVATLRALIEFYEIEVPLHVQPSLVLSVETNELGIAAGLQDRVIQVYDGLVYMDFAKESMIEDHGLECGDYERLPLESLTNAYVAFNTDAGQPTEVFHNDLRGRFERGESAVVEAMQQFAELTDHAKSAINEGDHKMLASLIDQNFDLRKSICQLPAEQVAMVEAARSVGASAKFAGSGGAIVGTYHDDEMLGELHRVLTTLGCQLTPIST